MKLYIIQIKYIMKTIICIYFVLSLASLLVAQQIILPRLEQQKPNHAVLYLLPVTIGKQTFEVALNFSQQKSWIKSNNCTVCIQQNCSSLCSKNIGPTNQGFNCKKGSCQQLNQRYEQNNLEGRQIEADVKIGRKKNKINIIEVQKIISQSDSIKKKYDGVFNLGSNNQILNDFALAYKNNKKVLFIEQKIKKNYLDSKTIEIQEDLESNFQIAFKGLTLNNQLIQSSGSALLSLQTRDLVLPHTQFQQLNFKISNIQDKCRIESQKLICDGSSSISKIKDSLIGIQLKNHLLEMPFLTFVKNCKSKQCQIFIRQSEDDMIILGEVIFLNFGMHFNCLDKKIIFHRLKNSFSGKYHQIIKKNPLMSSVLDNHEHEDGIPGTPLGFLFHFVGILLKIGIALGIYYLVINLYLNKKEIVNKLKGVWSKKKTQYVPAFEGQFQNGGTLFGNQEEYLTKEFWQKDTIQGI